MTDVFISYKRRWRPQVEEIARALRELGVDVWFDADLEPGSSFSSEISREIRTARSVLACLTNDAFPHGGDEHGWVLGEATIGRDRKVLVAVTLEPTALDPPWNTVHVEDLSGFSPQALSADRSHWQNVLGAIGRHLDRPGLAAFDRAVAAGTVQALQDWTEKYAADPLVATALDRIEALDHPDRAPARGKDRAGAPIGAVRSPPAKAPAGQAAPAEAPHPRAERDRPAEVIAPARAGIDKRRGRRLVPVLVGLVLLLPAAGFLAWRLGPGPAANDPRADASAASLVQSPALPAAGETAGTGNGGASVDADRGNPPASASTDDGATDAPTPAGTVPPQGRVIDMRYETVALALPPPEVLQGTVEQLHEVKAD